MTTGHRRLGRGDWAGETDARVKGYKIGAQPLSSSLSPIGHMFPVAKRTLQPLYQLLETVSDQGSTRPNSSQVRDPPSLVYAVHVFSLSRPRLLPSLSLPQKPYN